MPRTIEQLDEQLQRRPIVDLGHLTHEEKLHLGRRIRRGEVVKYRGFWNTLSPDFGIGPPKTIYRLA